MLEWENNDHIFSFEELFFLNIKVTQSNQKQKKQKLKFGWLIAGGWAHLYSVKNKDSILQSTTLFSPKYHSHVVLN